MNQIPCDAQTSPKVDMSLMLLAIDDLLTAIVESALDECQRKLVLDFLMLNKTITCMYTTAPELLISGVSTIRWVPTPAYLDFLNAVRGGANSCMKLVTQVLSIQTGLTYVH